MIKSQKKKDELRIRLPKSLRNLIIGGDKISEDFGLSIKTKPKIIKGSK